MRLITSMFIILLLLTGCSSKPSLELISSTVEIKEDQSEGNGITSAEKNNEFIQPLSLSYHFILKNTGKKALGKMEKINNETFEFDDGIKVYIVPSEKLAAVSKEVMGFIIFDEENNAGIGKTSMPVLEPNQEGEYTLNFYLGALEEYPEIMLAPSAEQLDKLKKIAMDATLIVVIENEEIARFDLSK